MIPEEIHKIAALEGSHWWYVGMREISVSMLRPFTKGRDLRILDVGCGTGGNLRMLSAFGEARGVDIDPLCVDYCRKQGLSCDQRAMGSLNQAPGSLDLVTMFDVLTQAESGAADATLAEINTALAPGGLLAFRDPAMRIAGGTHHYAAGVQFRYSKPEVLSLLARTGFEPLRVTYLNTLLFPPIVVTRRLQDIAGGRSRTDSDVQPAAAPIQAALLAVLRLEKRLLRLTDLPFGVSVFTVARKRA